MPYADPLRQRAYLRQWKLDNRAHHRELTRLYDKSRHANKKARIARVPGTINTADVRELLADAICAYCGIAGNLTIDHVIAMSQGGSNTLDNIVPCCGPCNKSKWQVDRPWRWARYFETCRDCDKAERPHICHGLCTTCYYRRYRAGTLDEVRA